MVKITKKLTLIVMLMSSVLLFPAFPFTQAADFSTSTIVGSPDEVNSLSNSTITVTVQGTGGIVDNASVGIFVEGGLFPGGTNIHNATTDSNGQVIVEWKAPLVDYDTTYNFTASIRLAASQNKSITTEVLVKPLDFSGSTIDANPQNMNEKEATLITVVAQGDGGVIEGADIQLDGIGGVFTSSATDQSIGQTDASGVYTDYWTAPAAAVETNYTIVLTITYQSTNATFDDELTITVNPVEGQLVYDLDITPGFELGVGQIAIIELTVYDNATDLAVYNASVTFSAIDGIFTESGLDSYTGFTDVLGKITVHWDTSTLVPAIGGTFYPIDVTVVQLGLATNYSTLTFHVQEVTGELVIGIASDETSITLGESVTITITITVDGSTVENANIAILAPSGEFTESGTDEVEGFTNAAGQFVANWDTTDMVMVGSDPLNYTLTITVDIFPNFLDQQENYIITVTPVATTPPNGSDDPFYTQWWFIVAVGGGIIVIGAIILFAKKR